MAQTYDAIKDKAQRRFDNNWTLKSRIIDSLGLETSPELISDNQPLFGRGLEMDSLDTLEIVVMVEEEFGVAISDSDTEAFGSINAMMDFIEAKSA
ncbi:acyl carrier protein [Flexivirga meconopsidis]|uniref:acyl carrier protein n=1 Tax=Flexivirga meconopsidis TaxID=2977121 RepID=UPI00223FE9C2|nr:phosphopantetheine-binding protein [Flexivirga meconopsidis]